MLTFYHHFASLPCVKVRLFLEEVGQPYEAKFLELGKLEHRTPEFLKKNPFGQVPFIECDGLGLAESNAVLRYLAEKGQFFDLFPKNLEERAQVDQWVEYLTHSVCEPLSDLIWYRGWAHKYNYPVDQMAVAKAEVALAKVLPICENHLQSRNFFAAPHMTLADIALLPYAGNAYRAKIDFFGFPRIKKWLSLMTERPAWKKVDVSS